MSPTSQWSSSEPGTRKSPPASCSTRPGLDGKPTRQADETSRDTRSFKPSKAPVAGILVGGHPVEPE